MAIMIIIFILLVISVLFYIYINFYQYQYQRAENKTHTHKIKIDIDNLNLEYFDDYVSYEKQERAGPVTKRDLDYKKILDAEFPKIPTYFVPFKRFYIELFEGINYENSLVSLKDTTEQLVSVRVDKPIKSIRIRSVPNAHWIYVQFFSVGIYLESDVTRKKGVIFHIPNNNESVEYEISDTNKKGESLEWMTNNEPKIVYFTTNIYNPIDDLGLIF